MTYGVGLKVYLNSMFAYYHNCGVVHILPHLYALQQSFYSYITRILESFISLSPIRPSILLSHPLWKCDSIYTTLALCLYCHRQTMTENKERSFEHREMDQI